MTVIGVARQVAPEHEKTGTACWVPATTRTAVAAATPVPLALAEKMDGAMARSSAEIAMAGAPARWIVREAMPGAAPLGIMKLI